MKNINIISFLSTNLVLLPSYFHSSLFSFNDPMATHRFNPKTADHLSRSAFCQVQRVNSLKYRLLQRTSKIEYPKESTSLTSPGNRVVENRASAHSTNRHSRSNFPFLPPRLADPRLQRLFYCWNQSPTPSLSSA